MSYRYAISTRKLEACPICGKRVKYLKLHVDTTHGTRKTRDLCQTCWEVANPGEYFPTATRFNVCVECNDNAMVVRSR